jgi:hypothetical protein
MLPRPEGRVEQDQLFLVFAFREARVPRIAPRPTPGLRFGANCGLARDVARCTKSANLKLSPRPNAAHYRQLGHFSTSDRATGAYAAQSWVLLMDERLHLVTLHLCSDAVERPPMCALADLWIIWQRLETDLRRFRNHRPTRQSGRRRPLAWPLLLVIAARTTVTCDLVRNRAELGIWARVAIPG